MLQRWIAENEIANEQGDRSHGQLREHGHRQQGAGTAYSEFRLDFLLEDVNVVLEFAGEKFADFLVDAIHIRDQRQQAEQEKKRNATA